MTDTGKAQWLKLTVVQLKGALTMRGLETDGKKSDLVERLISYEAKKEKEEQAKKSGNKTEVNGDQKVETEEKKAEKEKPDEDPYYLPRGKFVGTYRSAAALLTVLITPFNDEFFATEVFSEHVKKTKTFKLQKIWNGTSAAELRFATVAASEEAFLALKHELASMDVDVYHPGFRTNFHKISLRNLEYDKIFEGMEDDEASYERIIILDKLPEGATDATLAEAIPEAIEFVDIGLYEESKGCMAVAFNSKKTCQEWLEKNPELTIDGAVVRFLSYFKREKNSNMVRSKMAKEKRAQEKAEGKTEEPALVKLSNDERLAKVKEWNSLLNSRNVLQDRDDITGYEKLAEDKRITEGMTNLARELLNDAKEKLANKEKLPEPEDQMTAPVRNLVKGETPVTVADKKTKKKKVPTATLR